MVGDGVVLPAHDPAFAEQVGLLLRSLGIGSSGGKAGAQVIQEMI
jgi:hypothetical protein